MATEAGQKKTWYEVLATLTPLIIGLCITGVGAVFTNIYNYRQLQLNQLAALDKFRTLLVSDKDYEREFAYASFAALGYEALALKIIAVKQDSAGRGLVEQIKQSADTEVQKDAAVALTRIPAKVYIQIGRDDQRKTAELVAAELRKRGVLAQGVENVSGKARLPQKSSVRYFNPEDKDAADQIVTILKEQGVTDAYAFNVTQFKVKPGSLEIWFSGEVK